MSRIDDLISKYCPNGVKYFKLEDLAVIDTGKQLNKELLFDEGEYPVMNGGIYPSGRYNEFNSEKDNIAISQGGASAGYVNWMTENFWAGAHCYTLTLKNEEILNKYLYYVLKNNQNDFMNSQKGAGIPSLSRKELNNLLIPVPPLPVQEEIVKILDSFTMLEAELEVELEAELEARKKQYEHYRDKLLNFADISQGGVRTMALWEITNWDKKFNGIDKKMQEKIIKYPYLLADELFSMEQPVGNVFLLSTGENVGWTTEEIAGDKLCEGEVVTIPWGKSRPVVECMKYYNGKFVTADNRIATSKDTSVLNNKYLFYWMQNKGDEIDKFYRGAGIQHPSMKSVLTMQIVVPPLEEQERIVSILDKFDALVNDISEELSAEIKGRHQQYEYHRNKLLDFKELPNE